MKLFLQSNFSFKSVRFVCFINVKVYIKTRNWSLTIISWLWCTFVFGIFRIFLKNAFNMASISLRELRFLFRNERLATSVVSSVVFGYVSIFSLFGLFFQGLLSYVFNCMRTFHHNIFERFCRLLSWIFQQCSRKKVLPYVLRKFNHWFSLLFE